MSDITRDALAYIGELQEPYREYIEGYEYSDKKLFPIIHNPLASQIEMSTLTGLLDYIASNTDELSKKMIVHVVSPERVALYSCLDEERDREQIASVRAKVPDFQYESYVDHERFCIALQAKFLDAANSDKSEILRFAGTVEDGTVSEYGDDGVTQKATVKTGIASKSDVIVPNPVKLRPYRTFHEVEQPMSDFIFRMRSEHGVQCALFEADGGSWKNEAMQNIKKYLCEALKDKEQFVVIA